MSAAGGADVSRETSEELPLTPTGGADVSRETSGGRPSGKDPIAPKPEPVKRAAKGNATPRKKASGAANRRSAGTKAKRTASVNAGIGVLVSVLKFGAITTMATDAELSRALLADAEVIAGPAGQGLADAIVTAADSSEALAKVLDSLGTSSPWVTVLFAAIPVATGIAANHGVGFGPLLAMPTATVGADAVAG